MNDPKERIKVIQVINTQIKNTLRNELQMNDLGNSKYFDKEEDNLKDFGLSVKRGFRFTIAPIAKNIFIQVDVCSRVLQSINFL